MLSIEVEKLRRTFGARDGTPTVAVDNVDLQIGDSEFVSLLGPSGCGKSTLLSLIAGLIQPTSGEVRIDGRAVSAPYTNIGIVFQNDLLLDWRTVLGATLVILSVVAMLFFYAVELVERILIPWHVSQRSHPS